MEPINEETSSMETTKKPKKPPTEKCIVCDYPFGQVVRTKIECKHCNYTACKACYKQYFLSKANPQCMNCNTIWNQDILESHFPRTWCNSEYRKHTENVMFQQELSLIPLATQELNKRKLAEERENMTESLMHQEHQIDILRQTVMRFNRRAASGSEWAIIERDQQVPKLEERIRIEEEKYNVMVSEIIKFNDQNSFDNTNIVSTRPCFTSKCKGFLNFRYECVVCDTVWCKDCHERVQSAHVCDQNLVKTYKMLEKDTKNCPGCKTLIFKISGCDQMYCINCNTAFSWETGQIEKGRIHNPHYFEYLQRREREQQEQQANPNECVELSLNLILKMNHTKKSTDTPQGDFIVELERFRRHVEETNLQQYTETLRVQPMQRNLDLRIQYILNKIDEKTFRSIIVKRDTDTKLCTHYYNLMYSLTLVCRDVLVRYLQDSNYLCNDVKSQIIEYAKYFNTEMEKVSIWFEQSHKKYLQINEKNIFLTSVKRVRDEKQLSDEELDLITSSTEWLDEDEKKYIELYELCFTECITFCDKLKKKQSAEEYQQAADIYTRIFDTNTNFCEALWDYEEVISRRNKQRIRTNILKYIMSKFGKLFRLVHSSMCSVYSYIQHGTLFSRDEVILSGGYRMILFYLPLYAIYCPNQIIAENTVQCTT